MADNDKVLALEEEIKRLAVPSTPFEEFTAYKIHDMYKRIFSLSQKNRCLWTLDKISWKKHEELMYNLLAKHERVSNNYWVHFGGIPRVCIKGGIHKKIRMDKAISYVDIIYRIDAYCSLQHPDNIEFMKNKPQFRLQFQDRELEYR